MGSQPVRASCAAGSKHRSNRWPQLEAAFLQLSLACTSPLLALRPAGVGGDYEPRSLGLLKRSGTYVSLRAGPSNAAILASTLKG